MTPEGINSALENIEQLIGSYSTFSIDDVDDEYLRWIYEAILYTYSAPVIRDVRSYARDIHADSILADIPIYLVIGGFRYSGKTHLLELLYKSLSNQNHPSATHQYSLIANKHGYGSNLSNTFSSGNLFPLFVVEAKPAFFKGRGAQVIKEKANSVTEGFYAPVTCSTNAGDYAPAEGAERRLKYLPPTKVFDKQDAEGERTYCGVLEKTNNELAKEFLSRFTGAPHRGKSPYDDKDYLSLSRRIFLC